MNARTVRPPPTPYPEGLTCAELLAEWEARLSLQLVEHEGGCLEWTGLEHTGACHAPVDLRAMLFPRRKSLTFTVLQALWICRHGSLPAGNLLRTCRKSWCVAPEHRELWTPERKRLQRQRSRERERIKRLAQTPKAELLGAWEVSLSEHLIEHESGCVEWTGAIDRNGVGVVKPPADVQRRFGVSGLTVAQALWLCQMRYHSAYNLSRWCSSPWCVAPDHHFAATPQHIRGRRRAQREARKRGQVFDLAKWGAQRLRERIRMRRLNEQSGRLRVVRTRPTWSNLTPKQQVRRRQNNRDAQRRRRAANPDSARLESLARRQANPERYRAAARARYRANPEKHREAARLHRRRNREAYNARARERAAARRAARVQQGTPP